MVRLILLVAFELALWLQLAAAALDLYLTLTGALT